MYKKAPIVEPTVDYKNENNYRYWVSPKVATQVKAQHVAQAEPPARVSSESLLGPRGELLIVHNGREYRLRLTQNGKLILTA